MPGGGDCGNNCRRYWWYNGKLYVETDSYFWWSWLPFWQRLLLAPIYAGYVLYLCLKGEIIEVSKYKEVHGGDADDY